MDTSVPGYLSTKDDVLTRPDERRCGEPEANELFPVSPEGISVEGFQTVVR